MQYEEVAASQPWMEKVWAVRGRGGAHETIFPDGSFELVFNLADPVLQYGDDGEARQPAAMLVGEIRRAVTIEPSGDVDMVGVRLRLGAAESLFGESLPLLRDRMDLSSLTGNLGDEIRERLAEQRTLEARAVVLGEALGSRMRPRETDRLAVAAASTIARHHGGISVSRLARSFGVSVTALRRTFHRAVGISPKTLCRVLRMRWALELLRRGHPAASAAATAGFFDQSHFVNEFRAFAGLSPSRYVEIPAGLAWYFAR